MRISNLGLAALAALAGCSEAAPTVAAGGETIECALAGAATFTANCAADRTTQGGTSFVIVRHPDGAFRRFQQVDDGRGLIAADGAETAQVTPAGPVFEVAIAADRYRIPAMKAADAAPQ